MISLTNFRKRCLRIVVGPGHRSGGRRRPRVLTAQQEGELAARVKEVAKSGFPVTANKVRSAAYIFAKEKTPEDKGQRFSEEKRSAGRKWFKNFVERHPELTVKKATQISKPRAKAVSKETIFKWFQEYSNKVINKYGIDNPKNIWNVDETSVRNIPRERRYVGVRGRRLHKIVGSERAETSTVIFAVNANGDYMPPLVIHRGKRIGPSWLNDIPEFWRVRASPKGYVTDEIFLHWSRMFLSHLKRESTTGHVSLTMDGHGSHVYNLPFVDLMKAHDIHVTLSPPHTTHAIQVLDQYPLESFKFQVNDEIEQYCDSHNGVPVPKSAFFSVLKPAVERSMTKHNIKAAFRVTGIYPLNPMAIPRDKFVDETFEDSDDDCESSCGSTG